MKYPNIMRHGFAAAVALFLICGCRKDSHINDLKTDAIILDLGNPAADGCGWVIRVGNIDYKPENLDSKWERDSLKVRINYDMMKGSYSCGIAANIGFSYIHLNDIRER